MTGCVRSELSLTFGSWRGGNLIVKFPLRCEQRLDEVSSMTGTAFGRSRENCHSDAGKATDHARPIDFPHHPRQPSGGFWRTDSPASPGTAAAPAADLKPVTVAVVDSETGKPFTEFSYSYYYMAPGRAGPFNAAIQLRLMPGLNDAGDIPKVGKNLVVLALVNQILRIRIFGRDGRLELDGDEKELAERHVNIDNFKGRIESFWPPHELTESERDQVLTNLTSIFECKFMEDSQHGQIARRHIRCASSARVPPRHLRRAARYHGGRFCVSTIHHSVDRQPTPSRCRVAAADDRSRDCPRRQDPYADRGGDRDSQRLSRPADRGTPR